MGVGAKVASWETNSGADNGGQYASQTVAFDPNAGQITVELELED